jgi:hypothetical protein
MIASDQEFQTTREYVERLQTILLELRRTHSPTQYQAMSRGFLKELTRAQREMAVYLAAPVEARAA